MSRVQHIKVPVVNTAYVHQAYPKLLYKAGETRPATIRSAEEEELYVAQGWGTKYVEPAPPPAPKTDVEIAVDQRDRSHKALVDQLAQRHEDTLGILKFELDGLKVKYAALEAAHSELSVERLGLINKLSERQKQETAFVGELETANKRADDLVAQLGAAQQELAELRKKAPIAPKFPNHKQKED